MGLSARTGLRYIDLLHFQMEVWPWIYYDASLAFLWNIWLSHGGSQSDKMSVRLLTNLCGNERDKISLSSRVSCFTYITFIPVHRIRSAWSSPVAALGPRKSAFPGRGESYVGLCKLAIRDSGAAAALTKSALPPRPRVSGLCRVLGQ